MRRRPRHGQEALDGRNVHWLQKVSDEEYLCGPFARAPEA
jgi:hypothetical protein